MNNDTIGQQKKKSQSTQDNEFVGTRVSFVCEGVVFYGTVKRCFMNDRRKKTWNVLYDNGKDEEDIYRPLMLERQKHYVRHGKYDPTLPIIPTLELPSLSTKYRMSCLLMSRYLDGWIHRVFFFITPSTSSNYSNLVRARS